MKFPGFSCDIFWPHKMAPKEGLEPLEALFQGGICEFFADPAFFVCLNYELFVDKKLPLNFTGSLFVAVGSGLGDDKEY